LSAKALPFCLAERGNDGSGVGFLEVTASKKKLFVRDGPGVQGNK